MPASRVLLVAAVAAARAVVTLALTLGFWAAAPVVLGWLPTTVMTASMSPAIEVGDVVVSRPMPPDALLPGRVVLADDPDWPDRLRLHRIAGIDVDGALITKGDANHVGRLVTPAPRRRRRRRGAEGAVGRAARGVAKNR
ncbi:signal peptidase I [Microbacterium testaceum]|uniref:S26 family signal peptidase n=1 Tax=Microbacterium testaceum TaxID=2033 RepID=UPI00278759ED|nr:S26 family signal peptidase [Microbacterium testaceum]MDQ1171824.1 signal peptidase I [Microbacterium testaceum]